MNTPRPTPETNLFMDSLHGYSASWEQFAQEVKDFARKLERERDENREWALGTERERNEMIDQLKAMREAIKKGHDALTECVDDSGELLAEHGWWKDEPRCGYQIRYDEHKQRIENAEAALAKLKPFLP